MFVLVVVVVVVVVVEAYSSCVFRVYLCAGVEYSSVRLLSVYSLCCVFAVSFV